MRNGRFPRWMAIVCAVLLLPSWLHAKTVVVIEDGGQEIQGWGWQNVASWAGFVALVSLLAGRTSWTRLSGTVLSSSIGVMAFILAAAETSRYWIDLNGVTGPTLYVYRQDLIVRPATGMGSTIVIALTGALFTVALIGISLRRRKLERS